MSPIKHIRKFVLKVTQAELARIAGTTQGTVSRWDDGELEPNRAQLNAIREAAISAGIDWNDTWVFEVPQGASDADGGQDIGVAAE